MIIPLILLALVVLIHFTFVNINIGLGVFSVFLRWKSINNPELDVPAKKSFKFLAATEVVSGFFGTMITVILAALWPTLVNIVTIVLFIPLYISIIGILLRMTSIIGFWYTWDRIKPSIHLLIGVIMAISGFLIPMGFRYIFALIDDPVGVLNLAPLQGDPIKALANPIYPPLILHTWFGALSIGFFALATGFAWASRKDSGLRRWAAVASLAGALMIVPQGFVGFWFWSTLGTHTQYLFYSINQGIIPVGNSATNVSATFLIMVVLAIYLMIAGVAYYYEPEKRGLGYTLAPLSALALIFGEFTHDYGRLPYMVITGKEGFDVNLFVNKLVILDLSDVLAGLIPILVIAIIFVIFMYLYLVKGFLDTP